MGSFPDPKNETDSRNMASLNFYSDVYSAFIVFQLFRIPAPSPLSPTVALQMWVVASAAIMMFISPNKFLHLHPCLSNGRKSVDKNITKGIRKFLSPFSLQSVEV